MKKNVLPFQLDLLTKLIQKNRQTGNSIASEGYLSGAEQDGHHDEGYQHSMREMAIHDEKSRELENALRQVAVITPVEQSEFIQLGNGVEVRYPDGETIFFVLTGYVFEPVSVDLVSILSPLGRTVIGAKVGEKRNLNRINVEIKKIFSPKEALKIVEPKNHVPA